MKKICVITTGGTIDSHATGDSLSVSETTSGTLVDLLYAVIGGQAAYDITSPLNKNSEDFSLHDIEAIAAAIDRKAREGCSLFLVTHGSDTLHFTAAALGLLFAGRGLAICLVAAFRPLFAPGSDGPDNLRAAVAWLLSDRGVPDTYVALKQDIDAEPVLICHWRDVKPLDFDSRGLASLHHRHVARVTPGDGIAVSATDGPPAPRLAVGYQGLGHQSRSVRLIDAYVGLDGGVMAALAATAHIVVLGAYHSGTLPSAEAPGDGVTGYVKAHPETLFLLARHPDRIEGYASVKRFEAAGGIVIRHLLPHQAYMLACLLLAGGSNISAIRDALRPFSEPSGS